MTRDERGILIKKIKDLPKNLEKAIAGLNKKQMDTPYRESGWTPRQVVHHIADSHMNAYIRAKLAVSENHPTIKPYDQDAWAEMEDGKSLPVDYSMTIIKALHARWGQFWDRVQESDWSRTVMHPANGVMSLERILLTYANHGEKHCEHINGLRVRMGWTGKNKPSKKAKAKQVKKTSKNKRKRG